MRLAECGQELAPRETRTSAVAAGAPETGPPRWDEISGPLFANRSTAYRHGFRGDPSAKPKSGIRVGRVSRGRSRLLNLAPDGGKTWSVDGIVSLASCWRLDSRARAWQVARHRMVGPAPAEPPPMARAVRPTAVEAMARGGVPQLGVARRREAAQPRAVRLAPAAATLEEPLRPADLHRAEQRPAEQRRAVRRPAATAMVSREARAARVEPLRAAEARPVEGRATEAEAR